MSAAPPQGGLTQALGGEKRSVFVLFAAVAHRLRLVLLFGNIVGALPPRPSLRAALTHHMRYVRWLRKRRSAYGRFRSSRCGRFVNTWLKVIECARKLPGLGFRQVLHSFTLAGFLPA